MMAIGERIHFFRKLRGLRQKQLGVLVGFPEKSADVRLAQYEAGVRTPKAELTAALAEALDVSPRALNVPDIDTPDGRMHTLFAMEDRFGLTVDKLDGCVCLRVKVHQGADAAELSAQLQAWHAMSAKLQAGKISREEYDRWRYHYPEHDATRIRAKVPSAWLTEGLGADSDPAQD